MGVYTGDQTILEPSEESLLNYKMAWKHSQAFGGSEKEYIFLYTRGKPLVDYCDDKEGFISLRDMIASQRKAAKTAKINLLESCIFDLIPEFQFKKWMTARHLTMQNIVLNVPKPKDYEILHKAHVVSETISRQKINYKGQPKRIIYNIFGSATGRFTTHRSSVPILTMKKEDRSNLLPQNDAFVELDYNAAEVRTLLALSKKEQPKEDL